MDPKDLLQDFQTWLSSAGIDVATSVPQRGFAALLGFYGQERLDGCDMDADGDMLLFQWGSDDWGDGEKFALDLTRQAILPDGEDDDSIWQLHFTYRFPASDELRNLGNGYVWCSAPGELPAFTEMLQGAEAYRLLRGRQAESVSLEYECAG